MIVYKLDLMWTIFGIFCGYQAYTAFVIFFRHDNKGKELFKNLRLPFIVAIYFLIPCIALYLTYHTIGLLGNWLFWILFSIILSLSFFLVFYITTMPEWPVGKFLQIQNVPIKIARKIMSLNLAFSLLTIIAFSIILYKTPVALSNKIEQIETINEEIVNIEKEKEKKVKEKEQIQNDETTKILVSTIGLITAIVSLSGAIVSYRTSEKVLNSEKKKDEK